MPDLVTHLSVAYLFKRWTKILEYSVIFYLGTILPDILSRPFNILFPSTSRVVLTFHAPIPLIFVCCLLTYFFDEQLRKGVFVSLVTGIYLHLLLDFFQKHIEPEFLPLFPFSEKAFEFGLFWAEDSLYTIPFWIILIIIMEFILKKQEKVIKV